MLALKPAHRILAPSPSGNYLSATLARRMPCSELGFLSTSNLSRCRAPMPLLLPTHSMSISSYPNPKSIFDRWNISSRNTTRVLSVKQSFSGGATLQNQGEGTVQYLNIPSNPWWDSFVFLLKVAVIVTVVIGIQAVHPLQLKSQQAITKSAAKSIQSLLEQHRAREPHSNPFSDSENGTQPTALRSSPGSHLENTALARQAAELLQTFSPNQIIWQRYSEPIRVDPYQTPVDNCVFLTGGVNLACRKCWDSTKRVNDRGGVDDPGRLLSPYCS